ncbi:CBS domain-containing protein [Amycolatopsis sp. CA-161197]|uniref:CBS domain-containing protein n=1 Tax=Amycolatopsis sp. CA-161197 TaxID=3239922 RepID=UPI003D9457CE
MSSTMSAMMTGDPITVSTQAPFEDLARLLTGTGISAVGVLDKTGVLVGVVSAADLLPQLWDGRKSRWRERRPAGKATACVAKDLMTSPAVTIDAGAPLSAAAEEFARRGVGRLFVLSDDRAGGVLSRRDLVTVFTHGDVVLKRTLIRDLPGVVEVRNRLDCVWNDAA